jgi:hypothetical protein
MLSFQTVDVYRTHVPGRRKTTTKAKTVAVAVADNAHDNVNAHVNVTWWAQLWSFERN